jgi:hypothetical protein
MAGALVQVGPGLSGGREIVASNALWTEAQKPEAPALALPLRESGSASGDAASGAGYRCWSNTSSEGVAAGPMCRSAAIAEADARLPRSPWNFGDSSPVVMVTQLGQRR